MEYAFGGTTETQDDARAAAPRTATEELIAGIWSSLLGLEEVGIHDNLIDSGGNSITASQCVSRIRAAGNAELPLAVFFAETATIAELARILDMLNSSSQSEEQRPLWPFIGKRNVKVL